MSLGFHWFNIWGGSERKPEKMSLRNAITKSNDRFMQFRQWTLEWTSPDLIALGSIESIEEEANLSTWVGRCLRSPIRCAAIGHFYCISILKRKSILIWITKVNFNVFGDLFSARAAQRNKKSLWIDLHINLSTQLGINVIYLWIMKRFMYNRFVRLVLGPT